MIWGRKEWDSKSLPNIPDTEIPWSDIIREARRCEISYTGLPWVVDPRGIFWCPSTGTWLLHVMSKGLEPKCYNLRLKQVKLVSMEPPGTAETKIWRKKWAKPGLEINPGQVVVL